MKKMIRTYKMMAMMCLVASVIMAISPAALAVPVTGANLGGEATLAENPRPSATLSVPGGQLFVGETMTATLAGMSGQFPLALFDYLYGWTTTDASVASLTNETTSVATITGVAVGTADVVCNAENMSGAMPTPAQTITVVDLPTFDIVMSRGINPTDPAVLDLETLSLGPAGAWEVNAVDSTGAVTADIVLTAVPTPACLVNSCFWSKGGLQLNDASGVIPGVEATLGATITLAQGGSVMTLTPLSPSLAAVSGTGYRIFAADVSSL